MPKLTFRKKEIIDSSRYVALFIGFFFFYVGYSESKEIFLLYSSLLFGYYILMKLFMEKINK